MAPLGPRIIATMLLALDVGNTNITLGIVRDGVVGAARRAPTRPSATVGEMDLLLDGLLGLDGVTLAEVREIAVASVVPAVTDTITSLAGARDISLLVASAATVPLPVRVERPDEVGADRLVNALAAARLYGTPAIVVDFGTATNFDVVAADGAFIGGAIAPGLELGIEALAARTAKLPRIQLAKPVRAIGRDTVSAMQSGAVIGYVGLVKELIGAIRAELALDSAERAQVILTGGLSAAPWAADIPDVDAIDVQLTLRGLALLHAESAARTR